MAHFTLAAGDFVYLDMFCGLVRARLERGPRNGQILARVTRTRGPYRAGQTVLTSRTRVVHPEQVKRRRYGQERIIGTNSVANG